MVKKRAKKATDEKGRQRKREGEGPHTLEAGKAYARGRKVFIIDFPGMGTSCPRQNLRPWTTFCHILEHLHVSVFSFSSSLSSATSPLLLSPSFTALFLSFFPPFHPLHLQSPPSFSIFFFFFLQETLFLIFEVRMQTRSSIVLLSLFFYLYLFFTL